MRGGSLPVAFAGTNMGRMTNRFLASYGLVLNRKIRNEPKASNPGVPQAPEAELIGPRNLRNYFSNATTK
jgi:hypothetical protein